MFSLVEFAQNQTCPTAQRVLLVVVRLPCKSGSGTIQFEVECEQNMGGVGRLDRNGTLNYKILLLRPIKTEPRGFKKLLLNNILPLVNRKPRVIYKRKNIEQLANFLFKLSGDVEVVK